jgi:tetratricopeptide (TPR) repeat protein
MNNGISIAALKRTVVVLAAVTVMAGCVSEAGRASTEAPDYIPGFGYHLMMAEIAVQRGAYRTAAEEYMTAAEHSNDPEISQRATQFAFDYGFDTWALRAARRWASLEPDEPSVRVYLARLYLRRDDVESALRETELALGPAAERDDEDYLLLVSELSQDDTAEALTRLMTRLATGAAPSPGLSLALATAAFGSGDLDLALESARAAASGDTRAKQLIARVLVGQEKPDDALAFLSKEIEATPTLQLQMEYARILAAAERSEEALAALAKLASENENDPDITRLRALVSLDGGDMEKAWEYFTALLAMGQHTDESFFYMAQIAEKTGRTDQATRLYRRVEEAPLVVAAQAAVARLAERNDDVQAALDRIDDFASTHPQLGSEAAQLRAGVLERAGRNEEALESLNDALAGKPEDVTLLLARGALLERTGRIEDAVVDMRAAVAAAPHSAAALNALGYTLADRTREHEEAYDLVRRAVEIEPDSGAILDSLGWVFFRQKRLAEARTYLSLAYTRLADPEVAAHLGEVMWVQGDRDGARQLWQEALERSPDSRTLQAVMARLMPR